MAKESTHRADELKGLGWSKDEIIRYIELWDYRQRWGAINLEREDRQFLRKAEASLPKIVSSKASTKKPIHEKSYYRWLRFYLEEMDQAEHQLGIQKGSRGVWPILLEEELRALDYYQPVLGLPDTLKAKGLDSLREEIVNSSSTTQGENVFFHKFDFVAPIEALNDKESMNWRPLREVTSKDEKSYPVLDKVVVGDFRKEARAQLVSKISQLLPSLKDTEKDLPPDDWNLE